jgi:hypothetical protein
LVPVWNPPGDQRCGRLGLALDRSNPTSKGDVVVGRVLTEGPKDDVDPGLVYSAVLVESGKSNSIRITVSPDERLD